MISRLPALQNLITVFYTDFESIIDVDALEIRLSEKFD